MRAQATRATQVEIERHINAQRTLGEDMPTYKEVTPRNLIVTGLIIAAFFTVLKVTGV